MLTRRHGGRDSRSPDGQVERERNEHDGGGRDARDDDAHGALAVLGVEPLHLLVEGVDARLRCGRQDGEGMKTLAKQGHLR